MTSAPSFELIRLRFGFRAAARVSFPAGRTSNLIRGLFGAALHGTAPAEEYQRLFVPRAASGERTSPSGLADWPRPFVFRVAPLDGMVFEEGGVFAMQAHLFDRREAAVAAFGAALSHMWVEGVGPERGTAVLESIEREEIAVPLGPAEAADAVRLRFVTPTELKHQGRTALRPDFGILLARLRDRIANLSALYDTGMGACDFAAMGERAGSVRLVDCELRYEYAARRSSRTGQMHPLGGFVGEAAYEGALGEFLPWLRAAHWVGVGRQTVWGKGEVRVIS